MPGNFSRKSYTLFKLNYFAWRKTNTFVLLSLTWFAIFFSVAWFFKKVQSLEPHFKPLWRLNKWLHEIQGILSCFLNVKHYFFKKMSKFRKGKTFWKLFKKTSILQTLRMNNLRILRIQDAKFSWYYFYINTNIKADYQICISVPLNLWFLNQKEKNTVFVSK